MFIKNDHKYIGGAAPIVASGKSRFLDTLIQGELLDEINSL